VRRALESAIEKTGEWSRADSEARVGRPDGIRRALVTQLRGQRQNAYDGDDRRGRSAHAIGQNEESYCALKMPKKETLLTPIPDEFHGWRQPSHQFLSYVFLSDWSRWPKRRSKPCEESA
jgi:hypothetical protein